MSEGGRKRERERERERERASEREREGEGARCAGMHACGCASGTDAEEHAGKAVDGESH